MRAQPKKWEYVTCSEFALQDELMGSIDLVMGTRNDFSSIHDLNLSEEEKSELQKEASDACRALFDHRYPIRIYQEEGYPRVIQAGTGVALEEQSQSHQKDGVCWVSEDPLPPLEETLRYLSGYGIDLNPSSSHLPPSSAVVTVLYENNTFGERLVPTMYMCSGFAEMPRAEPGVMRIQIPRPVWSPIFHGRASGGRQLPTAQLAAQLLRESTWRARQAAMKGGSLFFVDAFRETAAVIAKGKRSSKIPGSVKRRIDRVSRWMWENRNEALDKERMAKLLQVSNNIADDISKALESSGMEGSRDSGGVGRSVVATGGGQPLHTAAA